MGLHSHQNDLVAMVMFLEEFLCIAINHRECSSQKRITYDLLVLNWGSPLRAYNICGQVLPKTGGFCSVIKVGISKSFATWQIHWVVSTTPWCIYVFGANLSCTSHKNNRLFPGIRRLTELCIVMIIRFGINHKNLIVLSCSILAFKKTIQLVSSVYSINDDRLVVIRIIFMSDYRFKNKESEAKLRWLSDQKSIADVGACFASGNQGAIFDAQHLSQAGVEPKEAALKITLVRRYIDGEQRMVKNAKREIDIAQKIKLSGRHFLHVVDIFELGNDKNLEKNQDICYQTFLLMEKADLELKQFKDKQIYIRAELILDAALGVEELHSLNIAHRDLKPQNFLVFKTLKPKEHYIAKVTDFGCARYFSDQDIDYSKSITTSVLVGTGGYKPPEANDQKKKSTNFRAHDIFSFSIIILEFLFGLNLNRSLNEKVQQIFRKCQDVKLEDLILLKTNIQGQEELIKLCIQGIRHNPEDRPQSMKQFINLLVKYRDYQLKYRFQNKQARFSHLFQRIRDNKSIENIKSLIESTEESFVFDAVHWNTFQLEKCVIKIVFGRTPQQKARLRKELQNCNHISTIFNDQLIQFLQKPFEQSNNGRLYAYLMMEKEVDNFETCLATYSLRNLLSICYYVLKSLQLLHSNNFALGKLNPQSIRLFQKGQYVIPKIVDFSQGIINPSTNFIEGDYGCFLTFIYKILSSNEKDPDTQRNLLKIKQFCETNNLVELQNYLESYKLYLPNTLEHSNTFENNNFLQKLCLEYPSLKNKILESQPIQNTPFEFRITFLAGDRPKKARIRIQNMKKSKVQAEKMLKYIKMVSLVEKTPGFLAIYDAAYGGNNKDFAYIITEDYLCDCRDVNKLRKGLLITPNQIIADFTNILMSLKYFHRKYIAHMDIVPKNIFLLRQNNMSVLKLGNFGCCLTNDPNDYSVFAEFFKEDIAYKPPEYLYQFSQFEKAKRFSCDTWMIGKCFVKFLTGLDDFVNEVKLLDQVSRNQLGIKKAEEIHKFLNEERGNLEVYWNETEYSTLGRQVKMPSGNNLQIKTILNIKLAFAESLSFYYSFLSFIMINEQTSFKNYLITETNKWQSMREDYGRFLQSNSNEYFMYLASSWLHLICYLENICLTECQKMVVFKLGQEGGKNNTYKQQIERKINQVTNRYKTHHSFMEKIDPRIINQNHSMKQGDRLQKFKHHIELLLIMSRGYVEYTRKQLTQNEVFLLKGMIISFDIQNYIRNPDTDKGYPKYLLSELPNANIKKLYQLYADIPKP